MEITSGATVFLTGGAQGIGLGIAQALVRRGVRVALADIAPRGPRRGQE